MAVVIGAFPIGNDETMGFPSQLTDFNIEIVNSEI
jgi:hypothetical protein